MAQRPAWIEVCGFAAPPELKVLGHHGAGVAKAIQFSIDLKADSLLMCECSGRKMAAARQIPVIGILATFREPNCEQTSTTTPFVGHSPRLEK